MYSFSEESSSLSISLKEIYSATNNLSASNFIGQGIAGENKPHLIANTGRLIVQPFLFSGLSFCFVDCGMLLFSGKVYKGVLSDGQHVAIKHIIKDGQMETFVREVTSLSHIRHPNLVTLLAHYDGQNECFLVYELCHNGNLSEWLFGKLFINTILHIKTESLLFHHISS